MSAGSSWKCSTCGGDGMYRSEKGMTVCDCEAGRSRRAYLSMTDEERRAAFRERTKPKKRKPTPAQEEIPF